MSKQELPDEWGELLAPKGVHSYRDLAARTGIGTGTAHRLVTGVSTSVATVNKVADHLFDGDRDLVWRLHGRERHDYGDWELPAEASLLSREQREAIMNLIQVMIPPDAPSKPSNEVDPLASMDKATLRRVLEHLGRDRPDAEGVDEGGSAEADAAIRNAQ